MIIDRNHLIKELYQSLIEMTDIACSLSKNQDDVEPELTVARIVLDMSGQYFKSKGE
jgi:hypothetical protein